MMIICTYEEKKALIERLNADNGCVGCPVFNQCNQYESCEEALESGITWNYMNIKNKV